MNDLSTSIALQNPVSCKRILLEKIQFVDAEFTSSNIGTKICQRNNIGHFVHTLKSHLHSFDGHLIVNDHIDIAIQEELGLHIGWEDLTAYAQKRNQNIIDALDQIRHQMCTSIWLGVTVHRDLEKISMVSFLWIMLVWDLFFPTNQIGQRP